MRWETNSEICALPEASIETDREWFVIRFMRRTTESETTQKTTHKTTQKIVDLIRDDPEMTRKEMARAIGITEDGVKYHLGKLRKKGIIKRVGGKKGGHWEITEEFK
jgi:ATP-dependent DNA helicase RecG